jgi:hypothetical protein
LLFGAELFDAEHYFTTVLNALATCESYTELTSAGVIVEPQAEWLWWDLITWRAKIVFASGHLLDVLEMHEKKMKIKHYRKVKYHFTDADRKCIFRVDTHQSSIPFNSACHLHIGEQETRIGEGHSCLKGQSLVAIDFLTIFGWVHQHLEGKPFIWQIP